MGKDIFIYEIINKHRLHRYIVMYWASHVAFLVKNPPVNTGDARDAGLISWAGKIPCSRKWQFAPLFLTGNIPQTEEPPGGLQSKWSKSGTELSAHSHTRKLLHIFTNCITYIQYTYINYKLIYISMASLVAQQIKNLLARQKTQEMRILSLGWEDPLEEEMATHCSTLKGNIPWTEDPGGLQPIGSQRIRHD